MKILAYLWRRSPGAMSVAVLVGIVSGLTSAGLVAAVHAALRSLGGPRPPGLLFAFVALCLLNPLSRLAAEYLLLALGQRSIMGLRLELTERILATPLARLEELGTHRLLAALIDDVNALGQAMVQLPTAIVTLAVLAGCLLYLAWLSPPLFAALAGVMALGILSYQLPVLAGSRRFAAAREGQDRLFGHFRALTDGIQELQLNQRRGRAFVELVRASAGSLARLYVTSFTIFNVAANWGHLLFFVVLGVLIFGAPSLAPGESPGWLAASPQALTGYALTLLYLMSPLHGFLDTLPAFSRAKVALDKIETLGFALREGGVPEAPPAEAGGFADLALRAVRYTYREEGGQRHFTVGPIDLDFEPGELVFIVGGNGSGKTTFAKLLVGLYSPQEGEIVLDGETVDDRRRGAYRQRFAAVFSPPFVFEELLGMEGAEVDQQSRFYLEALDLGKKVTVEEGRFSTTALSQGQRKRLALVTAYLEDRPIYLFDEWAADQDPAFRRIFYSRILPQLKARGKTVFVITHDDRYYSAADRILRFELGRVTYDGDLAGYLAAEHAVAAPADIFDRDPFARVAVGAE